MQASGEGSDSAGRRHRDDEWQPPEWLRNGRPRAAPAMRKQRGETAGMISFAEYFLDPDEETDPELINWLDSPEAQDD